jgi:hypothetical protein
MNITHWLLRGGLYLLFFVLTGFADGTNMLYPIEVNGRYGYVNGIGRKIVDPVFSMATEFNQYGFLKTALGWQNICDVSGVIVSTTQVYVADARPFQEGVSVCANRSESFCIDKSGAMLWGRSFDELGSGFSEGLLTAKWLGKWGGINHDGVEVISNRYAYIFRKSDGVIVALEHRNGPYLVLTATGVVIGSSSNQIGTFTEGLGCMRDASTRKYGFCNKRLETVIACKYDFAMNFAGGLAAISLDGKYGFIDYLGQIKIPCEFDEARSFDTEVGLAAVRKGDLWGIIRTNGQLVLPLQYYTINYCGDGVWQVWGSREGRWGMKEGEYIRLDERNGKIIHVWRSSRNGSSLVSE